MGGVPLVAEALSPVDGGAEARIPGYGEPLCSAWSTQRTVRLTADFRRTSTRGDVFRNRELALAMQALPQEALEHAAETFFRTVDGAGDQRADYWRNRASPYLKAIWPKTPDVISESVSKSFSRACVAAGDAFPEALGQIRSWLQPLQYPDRIAHALHEANLDTQFPEPTLELLSRIFGDKARGFFPERTKCCLNAIRAAQPELEHDHRFQRLLEVLRTNGGDLN